MKVQVKVKRRTCRKTWLRPLMACGGMVLLIFLMFLLGKGPAGISFTSANGEQTALAGLHSQCFSISADELVADLTQQRFCETTVTASGLCIASDFLQTWMKEYLPESCQEGYLVIRSADGEIGFSWRAAENTVSRYEISDTARADIDPTDAAAFRSSAERIRLSPRVSGGEAYASSVLLDGEIKVSVPPDARLLLVYQNERHRRMETELLPQVLPGYVEHGEGWCFTLQDFWVDLFDEGGKSVDLGISGQYALKLQSRNMHTFQGYLTGELLFHYTNTPQSYPLADHYVSMTGKDLLLSLQKNIRCPDAPEEALRISGKVTRMDMAGINPFPDLKMWFRENTYVLPVSLLSVIISLYPPQGKKKSETKK